MLLFDSNGRIAKVIPSSSAKDSDHGSVLLELCVTTSDCAAIAASTGVARLELCSALELGGITPTAGLMRAAKHAAGDVPIRPLIRPHSGGFVFSERDVDLMIDDMAALAEAGADGFVIGAACADGTLDSVALSRMIRAADRRPLTLHRAFDLVPNQFDALETAITLGFDCILTSGGTGSPKTRAETLTSLTKAARGRIGIMAGGGVRSAMIGAFVQAGVDAIHGSFSRPEPQPGYPDRIGIPAAAPRADEAKLQAAIQALQLAAKGMEVTI